MAEQPHEACRKGHSYRGKQTGFHCNRSGRFPSCPETSIEHYEDKRNGAYVSNHPAPVFGKVVIAAAAQKTQHQEEEQDRDSDLSGKLVEEYTGEYNHREYQKEQRHYKLD